MKNLARQLSHSGGGTLPEGALGPLLDAVSDSFYILDNEWRFQYINGPATKFFNSSPDEILGKTFWDVLPGTRGSLFEKQYRLAMRDRIPVSFSTNSVVRPDRWLEIRVYPISNGLAVFFLDVTEQKLAVAALRTNQARMKLIVDAAPALISYIGTDYRYEMINRAYESWFGVPEEDVLGKPMWDVVGEQAWATIGPSVHQAMRGDLVTFDGETTYKGGNTRWIRATYTPHRDPSGEICGVMVMVLDTTEQKRIELALRQSEAHHRSLFEGNGVGNAEVDMQTGRFIRVNQRYCDLVGYSEQELLSGMTFLDITHPDDLEDNRRLLEPFMESRAGSAEFEKRYVRKDGRVIWVHMAGTILKAADGHTDIMLGMAHDISERKQAEEELRRTAEELRQINEAAPVAIWVSRDPACEEIIGNSMAQRLYQAEASENVSAGSAFLAESGDVFDTPKRRRFFDKNGRELSAVELPMQQAVLGNREIRDMELTVQQPNGDRIVILGSAVPLRDRGGGVRGCVSAFMDVTAQVEAQRALKESEERLRLAVSAAGIGYWSWDLDTEVCVLDETCAEMFGVPTRCERNEIFRVINPKDLTRIDEEIRASIEGIHAFSAEFRVGFQDDPPKWIASRGDVVRDQDGKAIRMHGVNIDITQRKRVDEEREKFVSLVENSFEFIGMCDLNGIPFFVNEVGLRITGLDSLDRAKRTPVKEFFFPEDQEFIMNDFFPRVLREGRGEEEIRFRHFKTGEARWMIYNVFPVKDSEGQVIGYATVSRDITDRRRAEEMLREADRRKDEFLATLAHELRNPLAPISNALQIWARVEKNPEQATRLREMMDRQVKQLKRLIDDLLDVSRISRGKIELRQEPIDLASTIEGAIESVRPYIDACGHRLLVKVPPRRVVVNGDAGRLMQVFGNLLHNAAKYTEGHGTIEIVTHVGRETVEVSVKDNGAGIPQEMLGNIFEAFTQVHKNLDRAQGGLGIGLTLVKNLLELHGGSITARSGGPGQGSEFIVKLPLVVSEPVSIAKPAERVGSELTVSSQSPRYKVLVVDDLRPSADTLALMLQDLGQETFVAYDGPAALRAVRQFQPDVIISDIAMPGMDGYHLAQCIRQEVVKPQVLVALTGYGQQHDKWRAFEAGFDYHLVKPTSSEALAALLLKVGAGDSDATRGGSEHGLPFTPP